MSKFCPEINEMVVYLDCLECDTKICKKSKVQVLQKAETKEIASVINSQVNNNKKKRF